MIHTSILQEFPNSADEWNYIYSATLLADGRLSDPAHPLQEFFSPFYMITHHERVFSLFPPGWPTLLALGVKAGFAGWINPLVGALTLLVLFCLGRELGGRWLGWGSVAFLGLSPFFLANSASFFAHPACLFSVLAAFCCWLRWDRAPRGAWALAMGALVGWCFSIRELTAVAVFAIPLAWFFFEHPRRWRFLGWFLLGFCPVFFLYLAYNAALTGHWFYPVRFLKPSEWLGFGPREIRLFDYVEIRPHGFVEATLYLIRNLGRLLLWTVPGLPLLALWGAWAKRNSRWIARILVSMVCLPLAYMLYPAEGALNYGPRFYYESLGFWALLAAMGAREARHWLGARPALSVMVGLCLLWIVQAVWLGGDYHQRIYARRTLERLINQRDLRDALVIVGAPSGDMTQGDLIRNTPGFPQAPVIYAWDLGPRNAELLAAFPHRTVYFFGQNKKTGVFYLKLLTLPNGNL